MDLQQVLRPLIFDERGIQEKMDVVLDSFAMVCPDKLWGRLRAIEYSLVFPDLDPWMDKLLNETSERLLDSKWMSFALVLPSISSYELHFWACKDPHNRLEKVFIVREKIPMIAIFQLSTTIGFYNTDEPSEAQRMADSMIYHAYLTFSVLSLIKHYDLSPLARRITKHIRVTPEDDTILLGDLTSTGFKINPSVW